MTLLIAITIGVLYACSLYLLLRRNIVKMLFGLLILSHASNLLIFAAGGLTREGTPLIPEGQTALDANASPDPLPQALILTAIVISFGVAAFSVVLIHNVHRAVGTGHSEIDLPQGERLFESVTGWQLMFHAIEPGGGESRRYPGDRQVIPGDERLCAMTRRNPGHSLRDPMAAHRPVHHGIDALGSVAEQDDLVDRLELGKAIRDRARGRRPGSHHGHRHPREELITIHGSAPTIRQTTVSRGGGSPGSGSRPFQGPEDG